MMLGQPFCWLKSQRKPGPVASTWARLTEPTVGLPPAVEVTRPCAVAAGPVKSFQESCARYIPQPPRTIIVPSPRASKAKPARGDTNAHTEGTPEFGTPA